ncbi:MAG: ABC-2 family transporter protein [Roseiflexaceae bacterium]
MEAKIKNKEQRTENKGARAENREPRTEASPLSVVRRQLQRTTDNGPGTIRRLLQLWKLYAIMDVIVIAADLKLGLFYYLSDAILNIAAVTGMLLLADRFAGIGAWTHDQIIFMLGYATVANGIVNLFGGYNVGIISRRVGRGQLDHMLVQPQPLWMTLLTEGFMPFSSSAVLIPGVGLLAWAISRRGLPITLGWLALLALNLLASAAVMLAFSFIWGSLAFWAPRAAEEVSSSAINMLTQLKVFPLDGLGPLLLGGLLTFLPVGFVAWYPCRALLGVDRSPWGGWLTPLVALLLALLAAGVFYKGMQRYARTGSQHYSGFGHRG